MEEQYSGVDILEALESAHNYNDYVTRLIRESTESKHLRETSARRRLPNKCSISSGPREECVCYLQENPF